MSPHGRLPINRDHPPQAGDVLIPKRGRDLDPVTVIHLSPGDRVAIVRDSALVEADPGWQRNRCASKRPADGARYVSWRELGRDFYVDAQARAENERRVRQFWKARGIEWKVAA
jgi:hypothetical protein